MNRRSTPAKEAVLRILGHAQMAMSQDAIERRLDIPVDRATIYRILNRLCEDSVLHRVIADDGKQYFALCARCDDGVKPADHFHFRCTVCQTIECLSVSVNFSAPAGYRVETVNCILSGVCGDCAESN